MSYELSHLDALEAESVHILREVAAEFERPVLLFRMTPRRVVGTDVFHAAILLWAAALAHLVGGNVDFELMGNILLGSLPGIWIGSSLADRVSGDRLRELLGAVLIAAGIALITKAV